MQQVSTTPHARPGVAFTRLAAALAYAKGDHLQAFELAARWERSTPEVQRVLKAAVAAGTTSDLNWASELVDFRRISAEFVSLLRPATIIGKLALRPVPPATRTLKETAGSNAGWVGEGLATAISRLSLAEVLLGIAKMQTTVVVTDELVKFSTPAAEASLQQLMVKALATALDRAFIDPTAAGTPAGPASVTYNAGPFSSSGSTAATVTADLKLMVEKLINAGSDLTAAAWVLHPRTALALSLLLNAGNQFAFPNIGPLGGTLLGLPAIVSAAVPIDTGNDTYIVLLDASRVLLADDELAAADVSTQSSIQLVDNPQTGAQSMVSLWANGLVGIRLTRWVNWKVLDTSAIAVLEDVSL